MNEEFLQEEFFYESVQAYLKKTFTNLKIEDIYSTRYKSFI
jgi:hypothetical protein